jgi:Mrp family chromosome partitioning ATPase/intein/homing endonuclease
MLDKNWVIENLRTVLDPEIGINIVELNMVRDIAINAGNVEVTIALTVAHCPMAKTLETDVDKALRKSGEVVSVKVKTTAMSKTELNDLRNRLQNRAKVEPGPSRPGSIGPGIERLGKRGIRNIIAVVSGKGGVGKSFACSMLACELRRQGYEVGVLDADLTGPSIAKVFGLRERPSKNASGMISPVRTKTGIKVMSINLILEDPSMPVIWRGPIVNSVIRQLYWDVDWGDLHYLIVDLPPGCVASGSQVFANPHPAMIEEVKPGDYVYAVDANIESQGRSLNVLKASITRKRVTDVIPQGEAEVFELRTKSRRIRATYNHPILTLRTINSHESNDRRMKYGLGWKQLIDLKPGDIVPVVKRLPIANRSSMKLPEIPRAIAQITLPEETSEDFCRIVGYFLGDGFIRFNPSSRTYQVLFAEPVGGKYRAKYAELLMKVFPGSRVYQDKFQFGILSRSVTELFRRLGLGKSALEKRLPPWVFTLPEEQVLAVIESYCDADGHHRLGKEGFRRSGWMSFESHNQRLLEDMRALAISIGLRVTNLNSKSRTPTLPLGRTYEKTSWGFECNIHSRSNKYGARIIRGNGKQAVGRGLVNEYLGFERVVEVAAAGRNQVYDLTVEDNHNFVLDGLIVHNTSDAPLTVFQSLPLDGVIIVSSPQDLASMVVTKAVRMAQKMNAPLLGLIENMSYLECSNCHQKIEVFGQPKGQRFAEELGVSFLGGIPVDPAIARLSDEGRIEEYSSPLFQNIANELRSKTAKQVEQLTQGLPIAWSAASN